MRWELSILAGTAGWVIAAAAHAAPACSVSALSALEIPDVAVTQAKLVAASAETPAHCEVQGTVATHGSGAPDGLARFSMQLPEAWKQRFLFLGVGGNAGTLAPSANQVDRTLALGKGYAVVLTDTGHVGDGTSAKWVRTADGRIDQAKLADFFYRAAHEVTVAGKAFVQAYYAGPILHAYFDGCSTGGRMALTEGERYPDDYSGIIAGDPAMDYNLNLARLAIQKAALSNPDGYISVDTLAVIDFRVLALCDALDGAKDGLIQNPERCPVKAEDLRCRPGETGDCLTEDQVAVLKSYTTQWRDRRGRLVYPPWQITDLSGPQGTASYTTGRTRPNLAEPAAPWGADPAPRGWVLGLEALRNYMGLGETSDLRQLDIDPASNVIGDDLLARSNAVFGVGEAKDPAALKPFLSRGGKLILYHGAADPSIPAARTVQFYRELTTLMGGAEQTEKQARLFLVPGMHHCGGGGGPDQFDTLTVLERWVEQGEAPDAIAASTRADSPARHELPLCPYPQQARYVGAGDVADRRNWACKVAG